MTSDKGVGLNAPNLIEIGLVRQPDNAAPSAIQTGSVLAVEDRVGIERLLRQDEIPICAKSSASERTNTPQAADFPLRPLRANGPR